MKKIILLCFINLVATTLTAQTPVEIEMGNGYANRVFFKLNSLEDSSFSASDWDIAFYRMDSYAFATRINDAKGIYVYEASDDPNDWNAIDLAQLENWTPLYNSDTDWLTGAFDNGSATYGWGEYNPATHHVEGTIIFVLEYTSGTYRKFMIEDYFGGYSIKYSTWNGSSWGPDTTQVISNNENEDKMFNYVNLETGNNIDAEAPYHAWDIVFNRYTTNLGGGMMYPVTGVLHHPDLVVAEHDETSGTPDLENLDYQEAINTIGHDWKTYTGSEYEVDSNIGYYVKYPNTQIYKIIFTVFEGNDTGIVEFEVEYMGQLDTPDLNTLTGFSLYPNPADKQVDLLFDLTDNADVEVAIFDLKGNRALQYQFKNQSGFFQKTINISNLSSGIYIVKTFIGDTFITRKLVVK